jgi:hypothetical protein
VRTYIDAGFWRTGIFAKSAYYNTARIDGAEYTDVLLVLDDCQRHLAEDVAAHEIAKAPTASVVESNYSTPYIELMWQAIDQFEIARTNQPIKENLVEWFLTKEIASQKVSRATAEYLASFVRLPESRTGGNRPWKVRAQQDH